MTKTFANSASNYGSEAYNELMNAKRDFPSYTVTIVKTASKKDSFKGLNLKYMEKYITEKSGVESEQMATFNLLCGNTDDELAAKASFGEIKMWFLTQYPEIEKARQNIDEIIANVATLAREGDNNEIDGWGYYTFEGCTALESVSFGNISDYISYPNKTPPYGSIGVGAFRNCVGLKSIEIPSYVTSICRYAFSGCDHLKKVVLPESLISIDTYAFAWGDDIQDDYIHKSYIIGDGIDNSPFNVNFPSSLEFISSYAFGRQDYIPQTLELSCEHIDDNAFWNGFSLKLNAKTDESGTARIAIGKTYWEHIFSVIAITSRSFTQL